MSSKRIETEACFAVVVRLLCSAIVVVFEVKFSSSSADIIHTLLFTGPSSVHTSIQICMKNLKHRSPLRNTTGNISEKKKKIELNNNKRSIL